MCLGRFAQFGKGMLSAVRGEQERRSQVVEVVEVEYAYVGAEEEGLGRLCYRCIKADRSRREGGIAKASKESPSLQRL